MKERKEKKGGREEGNKCRKGRTDGRKEERKKGRKGVNEERKGGTS